jgi:hypothetical protein
MKNFPSFAVSTLVPSLLKERALPQGGTLLYSPLWWCWTQPDIHKLWATIPVVRWVESGGWYNARWNWPSFGCLNLFSYVHKLANLMFY